MKRLLMFALITLALSSAQSSFAGTAAGNYSVGLGPVGNIFVVDSDPELDPGIGGYVYFDYRWSPQFSTQFSVIVTTEDGTGISAGDDGIEFLGIPTFDLKFYLFANKETRWDPYGLIGVGFYALSEGTAGNGTLAFGIGADLGLGFDFYVSERFSLGFATVFRAIGFIDSIGGNKNGTSEFPVSLMANVAYHW